MKLLADYEIAAIRELKEQSTQVVSWYAHGRGDQCQQDQATVRGPYHRWLVVMNGSDHGSLGDVEDDARYAAAAMNIVPYLLADNDELKHRIDQAENALIDTPCWCKGKYECRRCKALKQIRGEE